MEEASENGKELPHSAHANGMNSYIYIYIKHGTESCRLVCGLPGNYTLQSDRWIPSFWRNILLLSHNPMWAIGWLLASVGGGKVTDGS
jgi:hypothetical protein